MTFSIEPIWSWPVVVLTSAGLLVLVVGTYRVQTRALPAWLARTLLSLRLASVIVLTFAMLRPAFQNSETDDSKSTLIVLNDVSRSMNTKDMLGSSSRFTAMRSDLEKYRAKWKEFEKKVDVQVRDFDRELRPFDPDLKEGTGDQTAYGKTLDDVLREARDKRMLGVLLMTDGAHRAIPPYDADPFTVARKMADAQIPIYTSVYGTSSLATAALDLAIEDLIVPEIVFERNRVPVKAKLRTTGALGQKVRVRILVEDRTGKKPGESGELKPAPMTSQAKTVQEFDIKTISEVIPVELSFVPTLSGEVKIALEVEPAVNELLTGNNRRESIITVKKGGVNVAYYDALRPEQKWLRMISGAEKIQLDLQEIRQDKLGNHTKLDPSWFQRGRYDVFIIGDVRAEAFGPELLKQLATRLEEGAALLMTGGVQNFAVGGYAETPIANWLPVELDPAEFRPPGKINAATQYMGRQKMLPTEAGLRQYVMQLGPADKNQQLWLDLPPLMGATRLKPVRDQLVPWAATPDGVPLLFATTIQRSRVAAFAGDTTYLWCTIGDKPHPELHQRFWRQLILWLAKKEADSDLPVWVKVEPRNYAPGSNVSITFGARSAEGQPVDNAEFQVEVVGPDGEKTPLTPRKSSGEYSAEFNKATAPGDYWVRVSAKAAGQQLPFSAFTRFIVDSRDLELDYPSADPDFLKELSAITGGLSVRPEKIEGLLDRLMNSKSALTRIQVTPLWDNWWLLSIFVGLMSVEWFLRKKRGLV